MIDDFFIDANGIRRGVTHVKPVLAGAQYHHLCRYLDSVGDGTGDVDAIGDYSTAPQVFSMGPPPGDVWIVSTLIVYIRDRGFMRADEWANIGTLTNGVAIMHVDDSGVLADITNGRPLLVSSDLDAICADFRKTDYAGIHESLVGIIDFGRDGAPVRLVGNDSGRLMVLLRDDFTGIEVQRFRAVGFREIITGV